MITLIFQCGGCNAKAEGKTFITKRFVRLWSKSSFGRWLGYNVDEVTPDGWVASDPYTGCTYCPKCWQEIEGAEKTA